MFPDYRTIITSDSGFLLITGTFASSAGNPTGIKRNGLSFVGRSRICARNPIGLGVCVSVASPA